MPCILCYTRTGREDYTSGRYPGHRGISADCEHALHLAWSEDGTHFHPLRNNTGILFPKAAFPEGHPTGITKTLIDPWLFRLPDGRFGLCCIHQEQGRPDSAHSGSIWFYVSDDLVRFQAAGRAQVSNHEARTPACQWDEARQAYHLTWQDGDETWEGWTADWHAMSKTRALDQPSEKEKMPFEMSDCREEDILTGNRLDITEQELETVRAYLDEIRHVDTAPLSLKWPSGKPITAEDLPRACCEYSDGSVHMKQVQWDSAALEKTDFTRPGVYQISGTIRQKEWAFPQRLGYGTYTPEEISDPNMMRGMSDPCVTFYSGKYYLSSTGNERIALRCAERLEDAFGAEPRVIYGLRQRMGYEKCPTWAAELHEIGGTLYMLTALCFDGDWTKVQAVMLACHGDPMDPDSWEDPHLCVDQQGKPISERGISLDMTYFEDAGRHYVMWSNRLIYTQDGKQTIEPAEVDIATVDPEEPWRLTSPRVCVSRPDFGWDRCETEVDEGPYLLRHGADLFVTISGSSTGFSDLYCVGLLRAKSGSDLLNPSSWEKWPYPLLTRESVPGEFGPGHNNFVMDHETGDAMMVYHAVPHDPDAQRYVRHPGVRRVHFGSTGIPYLEMTGERDLNSEKRHVVLRLEIV